MEWMDEDMVDAVTPLLLRNLPNVYTFTKALSESLVAEAMEEVHAIIMRPSIVTPIWLEPLPGWCPNINGPMGLFIGAGKGVIRSIYCKSDCTPDLIPADIVANAIMALIWRVLQHGTDVQVINVTSSFLVKFSWEELLEMGREVSLKRMPLNGVAWYPGGSIKHSVVYHYFCLVMFHWIPAVLVDCLIFCLGYPPVLCRVQRRVYQGMQMFEYYTTHDWEFRSDYALQHVKELNARERRDYKLDSDGLDPSGYFENCILGARRYILKEPDETLPAAKWHLKIMWFVDIVFRATFWILLLYCLRGWIAPVFTSTFTRLGLTYSEIDV